MIPLLFLTSCVAVGPPVITGELSEAEDPRARELVTLNGDHPWSPPATLEEWEERREEALLRLRLTVGLEPMPPRPPLASSEELIAEREDYSVWAIRVESLPGHWGSGT